MELRTKELMIKELNEELEKWEKACPTWTKGTMNPKAVWMKPIFYWEPLQHAVVCLFGYESRVFGLRRMDDFSYWINKCMTEYMFNVKERN